jgi:Protein of unknown function (DUF1566)
MTTIGKLALFSGALMGILLVGGGATHAITAQEKCLANRVLARARLASCLGKSESRVIRGRPDTSTKCAATFTAALQKAAALSCRYLDNGDGTVTDTATGLMWEQKDNLDGSTNVADPHDADNVYSWGDTLADGTAYTDFLARLNSGASTGGTSALITGCFAGHCDWRLPSIVELLGIVDTTQGFCVGGGDGGCIDPAFGPTQSLFYWSATTQSSFPAFNAWEVDFGSYGVSAVAEDKLSNSYVRAVRSGS